MKYLSVLIILLLVSCLDKEDIHLPRSGVTVAKEMQDHSPIYIFFRLKLNGFENEGNETLAEVNRTNEII